MIISIHQPSYFPWLGLLHKIANSDIYMVMDEVQLSDSAYQHRNLFLTAEGGAKFLTIPFKKKHHFRRPFNTLEIVEQGWRLKHINFLRNSYQKHPYFDEIFPFVSEFYSTEFPLLIDAVMASMLISLKLLGIETKLVFQSQTIHDKTLTRGDLVVDLVRNSGVDCYLSGTGAQEYLNESAFNGELKLKYNNFTHPEYKQKNTKIFTPGLSCLDLLFNLGISDSRELFESTRACSNENPDPLNKVPYV